MHDDATVALVRARSRRVRTRAALVAEALEIGARVLDREQTGANAEWVKAELEKTSREVQGEFTERTRAVAEFFDKRVDQAFGPENGQVARELARQFGDESSVAVQNQLQGRAGRGMRRDARRPAQAVPRPTDDNPFAVFQRAWLGAMKQTSDQQDARLREMGERMQGLRRGARARAAEKEKAEAVAQEAERGTAKGRSFEEARVRARSTRSRRARATTATRSATSRAPPARPATSWWASRAAPGRPAGGSCSRPRPRGWRSRRRSRSSTARRAQREADFAVLVVPDEELIPAKMHELREVNGDKLLAVFDPGDGSRLSLEVAYKLARARVLMARGEAEGVDAWAIREAIERAAGAMGDVRRVKEQLDVGAKTASSGRAEILDALATAVRAQLQHVELLLAAADEARRRRPSRAPRASCASPQPPYLGADGCPSAGSAPRARRRGA